MPARSHTKRCPDCNQTLRPRGPVFYCANCETVFEADDLRPEPAFEVDLVADEAPAPRRHGTRRELFDD